MNFQQAITLINNNQLDEFLDALPPSFTSQFVLDKKGRATLTLSKGKPGYLAYDVEGFFTSLKIAAKGAGMMLGVELFYYQARTKFEHGHYAMTKEGWVYVD
jgi:hypothetical protein